MRRAALLIAVACATACEEETTELFNVFDPTATVEEVPCPGAEVESPWKELELPTDKGLADLWATGDDNIWIAGGQSSVLHFDGRFWNDRSPNLAVDLHAISGVPGTIAGDIWAVGRAGVVAHFDGAGWRRIDSGTDNDLFDLWAFSRDEVWFVGEDGVRRWNGREIVQENDWPKEQVNAIWAASPSELRLVSNTSIHHYDGARFETQPIEKSGKLADVWGTSAGQVYAIGHNTMNRPGFAELVDGQWRFSGAPPRAFYFSLWTLEPNVLWAGANDTTIFKYADGSWCREHLGGIGAINAVFGLSHRRVWAVGAVRDGMSGASKPIFLERRD